MTEANPPATPPPSDRRDAAAACVALAAFVAWVVSIAASAHGLLEADETMHWLYARHAGDRPWNLLHPWARPLYTLLLWPFALGGFEWAKALSVVSAFAAAVGLRRAGVALGLRHAGVAVAALFVQPFFFQQTFGAWTEIVFAAVVAWWIWALASRRPLIAAGLVSLLPLIRPEGFFIVGVAAVPALLGVCRRSADAPRRIAPLVILPLGVVAWWAATFAASGDPLWLVRNWPWKPDQHYGEGNWRWLAEVLPKILPSVLLPFAALGCFSRAGRPVRTATAAAALVLSIHAALWAVGAFGSAGYARYFVTLAPVFALLVALGVEALLRGAPLLKRFGERVPGYATTATAALAAVLLLTSHDARWPVTPPDLPPDARVFGALGGTLLREASALGLSPPVVYAAHPFVYLELPHVPDDRFVDMGDFRPAVVDALPIGSLLVVENRFFTTRSGNVSEADLPRHGFALVPKPDLDVDAEVRDARHDPSLKDLRWSLWRKNPP